MNQTYGGLGNEVYNRDEFVGVGVDESFDPDTSFLVANLNNVGEHDSVVGLDEEFQTRWEIIEFPIESFLCGGDGIIDSDSRLGVSNGLWRHKG